MKTIVNNIKNERGNTVKNQFMIIEGNNITFQSYKTIIAVLHSASAFIEINSSAFDYSVTTSRHFCNWFENVLTNNKPTTKEVKDWIKKGYIPASENCYNTNIDIKIVNASDLTPYDVNDKITTKYLQYYYFA